jgi:DNA-binding response OmpR family regulator
VTEILIVDDDEIVRGVLAWLFEDAGYQVRQAADGQEALDALGERAPDCMVLDLMMPVVDGLAVLRQRRASTLAPDTRVVILTAKDSRADEVFCWEEGADEFLTKPFDGDRLTKLVADLMGLSTDQLRHRREVGLAEARRLDAIDQAFPKA